MVKIGFVDLLPDQVVQWTPVVIESQCWSVRTDSWQNCEGFLITLFKVTRLGPSFLVSTRFLHRQPIRGRAAGLRNRQSNVVRLPDWLILNRNFNVNAKT